MARRLFYTDDIIKEIRTMQHAGKSNSEIALAIGTTPVRLTSRLHGLGLGKKAMALDVDIPVSGLRTVMIHQSVVRKFAEPAAVRNMRPQQLIRAVLLRIADEDLFNAILDDGE